MASAARGGVLLGQFGRHPAALGHGQSLAAGPLAYLCRLARATSTSPPPATAGARSTGRPSSSADVASEAVTQFAAVVFTHVDLVRRPVEGKGDRLGPR